LIRLSVTVTPETTSRVLARRRGRRNVARYTGRSERAACVASNQGHRRIHERIAAHDPDGAAEATFTHITQAWRVRRDGAGDPGRLDR
jgi:DNA-binding GntR family transcriptional regulator